MTGHEPYLDTRATGAMSDADARPPTPWKRWALVFAVALAARTGWGVAALSRAKDASALEFPDERQYWLMATSLHDGTGLRDELRFRATRMPLYPGLLSLFAGQRYGVVEAKVLQWVVGAVAAVMTAGLAGRLFGPRVGFWAGLLMAVDPFYVFFSSLLLTETCSVAALVGFWWLLGPVLLGQVGSLRRWPAIGAAAALNVYFRESSLGLVLLSMGFVFVVRRWDRRTLCGIGLATGVIVLALLPWGLRNRRVTGEWCWLTTRAGISLYDGVRPGATGRSDLGSIKQMPAVRNLREMDWNRYFLAASIRAIKDDPGRIVGLMGTKLARLWNLIPNVATHQSRLKRAVSLAWTVPTFALAVGGALLILKRRRRDGVRVVCFLLLPALYLSALHSLFIGSVRYRLGAVAFLEVLAAAALVALWTHVSSRLAKRDRSGAT